jgi:polyhydroxyalkanoate synthesis regulator phasin
MTPQEARTIVNEIMKEAEKAFKESGEKEECKYPYMVGSMVALFEQHLTKLIYDSTNDN